MTRFAIFMGLLCACQCEDSVLSLLQKQAKLIASKPSEESANKMRSYFVVGHHNGCPENYRSVRDEGQCLLAVSALEMKQFEATGAWADKPGGCFKTPDGRVSLNTGKGAGTKGAEPICEWKWGNYFKLGKHNGCPDHYSSVKDALNCEKAAKALTLNAYESSGTFSDKPSGCFADPQGRVFLNDGKGAKTEDHTPICEWTWKEEAVEYVDDSDDDSDDEGDDDEDESEPLYLGRDETAQHQKVCPTKCKKSQCATSANGEASTAAHNKDDNCPLVVNLAKCNKKKCQGCQGC